MADPVFAENPWSVEFWNLTRQGAYVRKYGVEVAKTKAREAGVKFGAASPRAQPHIFLRGQPPYQVIVQRRNIGVAGGGGGLIGAGSSGDGPPGEDSGNPGGGNGLIGAGSSGDGPPV